MKYFSASTRLLVFAALPFVLSCTSDSPAPTTDLADPSGTYRTNGGLDFSCVSITDPAQMPVLKISKASDGNYRLVRTDFVPTKRATELNDVTVQAKTDTLVLFRGSRRIGSLQMGTWRDYNAKKPQDVIAPIIQIIYQDPTGQYPFFYYGYRQ